MEDIFKTESRLRIKLIKAADHYDRDVIEGILQYFGNTLKDYSFQNIYIERLMDAKIRVLDREKERNVQKLLKANELVKKYKIFPGDIFTNPEDTRQSILDYDYYILPRTKTQYDKEEEEAKSGKSGKIPMDATNPSQKEDNTPSLNDD